MNDFKSVTFLCLLALSVFFLGWTERKKSVSGTEYQKSAKENADEQYYSEADFHNLKKFNTHVHISVFDSTFIKQAASDKFGLLTVNVASPSASPIDKQQEVALRLVKAFPENILYATTFSVDSFNGADWQQKHLII